MISGKMIFWIGCNDMKRMILVRAYCENSLEEKIALGIICHLADESKRFNLKISNEYNDFEPEELVNITPTNIVISFEYLLESDRKKFIDYLGEMSCF